MKSRVWRRELNGIVFWALAGAMLGALFGMPWLGISIALLARLLQHIRMLASLSAWLEQPKLAVLPLASGVWGMVYDGLLNLQKRNRKRKKKLAAILAEFQASTEALPDGAVVLGPHGEIAWFNKAAQALLGLRLPQDLGLRVPNLIRKPAFTEYFARGDFTGEVETTSPVNAEVMLSFRMIPYGNGQRLLIVRDVSEFKRLETSRRDFVANASHELRTPLTVLKGYLEIMEREARTSGGELGSWKTPITEMRTQAARMEALIGDMLKLARLDSDVLQTRQDVLDVPRMLGQLQAEAYTMSKGNHRLTFEVEPTLQLFGRESEIHSVFTNLVANAIQYTSHDGAVDVRWWSDDQGAHFSVKDSGIGIEERDIPRLTERFYRVDVGRSRAGGGTGLGLAIVKQALSHHESRLQIVSEVNAGSTFSCHFPLHRVHRSSLVGAVEGRVAVIR
jgi:two-component system phosphate regulon sensor histidine kinase PhoR